MANDKTTVYLIRHGECAGNKENRIRGCVDFPLNENGVLQAHALAEAMKDKKIFSYGLFMSEINLSKIYKIFSGCNTRENRLSQTQTPVLPL